MSRKRKRQPSPEEEPIQPEVVSFAPVFSPDFKTDLRWWYRQEPKKADAIALRHPQRALHQAADRIMDLIADILDGDPFAGLGKPEPLKYIAANTWSRRIDLEHRLVYQIETNRIIFLQARYHYQD